MKILVLFAVGVLGCSLAGAAIVSKCDLMNKLKTAILKLPGNVSMSGLTSDDFVAKIVCHVEMGSKFNTSVVTKLSSDQGGSSEERGNMGRNNGGKHEENNGGKSEGNKGGNNGGNNGGNKGGNNGGKSEGNKGGNNGGKK
ncbi:anti-sigma-I factor RsgI-like [Nematolebias whitei]|uniref:anti-sigma-I factor RsgI-like n=1 Tax=Nematolebias whitei TaxID=451745 RepID=UPI001899B7D6|nr:anti-sigma-I factor RsgI-like [Nematolebias whitei]